MVHRERAATFNVIAGMTMLLAAGDRAGRDSTLSRASSPSSPRGD
jgi:hypothetical protein